MLYGRQYMTCSLEFSESGDQKASALLQLAYMYM